jgi:hypothetical protein
MFMGCTDLEYATGIYLSGVTEMGSNCFEAMFEGCEILTHAPKLPSVVDLSESCYSRMFYGCMLMEKAPDILSTFAASNALSNMFYGCSELMSIKVAFMSDPDDAVFKKWTNGVKKSGTIYVPAGSSVSAMIPYKGEPGEWTKIEY